MSSGSSGGGRPSARGRMTPTSSRSSAVLQAAVHGQHLHRRDRSRSRSPRHGSTRDSVPRSDSSLSGSSRSRSSHGGYSHGGILPNGTPRRNRNVEISHILIKHKESRHPRDYNDKPITRTKDQAMRMVIDIHEKISGDLITFADAAVSYSECTSARRQGDIQRQFQTGRVQKSFEEAAYALAPGQLSHIIESHSGFHILQRRE